MRGSIRLRSSATWLSTDRWKDRSFHATPVTLAARRQSAPPLITRRGQIFERHIGTEDFVPQIQASRILRPTVSRVGVYKWVQAGKLKEDIVDGVSMIRVSRLRKFAAKHGYALAPVSAR